MSNELARPLQLIEAEINFYKAQTASGMIEIGKRLNEAKEQLPHGEWGKWLDEKVDFSERTARRFMQAASEFSNRPALADLGQTKLFALLDVPADERQDFMDQHNLEEMTTRQVEAATKEWKTKAEQAENVANNYMTSLEKEKKEKAKLQEELTKSEQALQFKKDDVKLLQDELKGQSKKMQDLQDKLDAAMANTGQSVNTEEVEKLQQELAKAKQDVEILKDQLLQPVEMEPAVVEKVPEEVERELAELKAKNAELAAKATQPGIILVKYKVLVKESLEPLFNNVLATLGQIKEQSPDQYNQYKKATVAVISQMLAKLDE